MVDDELFTVEKWVNEEINRYSIPDMDKLDSYDYTTSMLDHTYVDFNWDEGMKDFIW